MTGTAFGMLSVPTFLSAILLIYLFAVQLRWLPATGYVPFEEDPVGNLRCFVLPALTLALAEWPGIMRVLRSDMIATLQEDYIAMARAKGLKPARILFVHALKPSSLTLVTITGINIGRLIGGIEQRSNELRESPLGVSISCSRPLRELRSVDELRSDCPSLLVDALRGGSSLAAKPLHVVRVESMDPGSGDPRRL